MAYVPRTRGQVRTQYTSDLASRLQTLNPPVALQVAQGSEAYMIGDVLGVQLEGVEQQAVTLTKEILPDQADTPYLNRHGGVDGVSRNPAVAWSGNITITGTPSATVTFGTAVLTFNGLNYGSFEQSGSPVSSVTLSGGGSATVQATAASTGATTSLPDATILTWSSTPTNANSTATVQSSGTIIEGADAELDQSYAARIISRRQNRPASGNRADWQAWGLAVAGVADAYVYPNLHPTLGTGIAGAVTMIVMGPIALDASGNQNGDNATNSRFVSNTTANNVAGYIEGTNDVNGNAAGTGVTFPQLRPVTMVNTDYQIAAATSSAANIELQLTMATAYAFPFTYNAADLVLASPTPTTTTFSINGDVSARYAQSGVSGTVGWPIIVKVTNSGTSVLRGNYYYVTPTTVTYNGGTGHTDFVLPTMPGTPTSSSKVGPGAQNWQQLRLALFAYIDQLGPGDTSPASRWPAQETKGRSTMYRQGLLAALVSQFDTFGNLTAGVRGVLSGSVVAPGSDQTPASKTCMVEGDILIHP
jgi:uncharacterized phage protein gp47/JayE